MYDTILKKEIFPGFKMIQILKYKIILKNENFSRFSKFLVYLL